MGPGTGRGTLQGPTDVTDHARSLRHRQQRSENALFETKWGLKSKTTLKSRRRIVLTAYVRERRLLELERSADEGCVPRAEA